MQSFSLVNKGMDAKTSLSWMKVTLGGLLSFVLVTCLIYLYSGEAFTEVFTIVRVLNTTSDSSFRTAIKIDTPKTSEISECEQSQRQRVLQAACSNKSMGLKSTGKIMVVDKYKLMFCVNAKCGTSSFNKLLLQACGATGLNEENKPLLHNATYWAKHGIRFLRYYSKQEQEYRLKNYFKIMVVRHPLDRLLSAYKDKFLFDKSYKPELIPYAINAFRNGDKSHSIGYYKQFYPKWLFEGAKHLYDSHTLEPATNISNPKIRHYMKYIPPFDPNDEFKPSFEEFLQLVMYVHKTDLHWMNFDQACFPCSVHYDYIAKMETFSTDSLALLEKINATHTLPQGVEMEHLRSTQDTGINVHTAAFVSNKTATVIPSEPFTKTLHDYDSIHSSIIQDIFKRYKWDMNAFGYDFSASSLEAFCIGDKESEKSCC